MAARSRIAECAPSAATRSRAASVSPSDNVTSTRSLARSKSATADDRNTTPSSCAFCVNAAISGEFSTIWAKGSPGSTSPSKVRKTGRTTSLRRLSVTTMSRMGCASTPCHTPMVSNSRRAAATIAEARPSFAARSSAGSTTVTEHEGANPWRNAMASARPAKPAPPISTSVRCTLPADAVTRVLLSRTIALSSPASADDDGACAVPRSAMSSAVQDLLAILDLEQLEVNLFRGRSPQVGWQRVFGGQVVGQALVAACRTVDVAGRPPHSLHAYFLLPGDPKVPIIYEVDRIRDGTSFTTRRVVAIQYGQAIFTMAVSFHRDEPGMSHQARIPEVAKPEQLPNEADIKERVLPLMPDPVRRYYERERPIEWRPVELDRYLGKK